MKAIPIDLPPVFESAVHRVDIGKGQEDTYFVIPALGYMDPACPGARSLLSRWQPADCERAAMAKSSMRSALLAFASWAGRFEHPNEPTAGDLSALVGRFIAEHSGIFSGPDADLWYTRILMPGDPFQPMRLQVDIDPPLSLVEPVAE
jgi:hypothetical protein